MSRVLFLAQHVVLDEVAPNGSGAHAAATLAGLRAHYDVRALGASPSAGGAVASRRVRVPRLVSGARQDARVIAADRRFAQNALEVARSFVPDVVYERSEYFSTAGLRVSRRLGIPLVLEVNGRLARDVRTQYRSPFEPVGARVERAKLRRADAIVTVSPGLADILVELGAPPERVAVVPNSLPDERVAPERAPRDGDVVTIGWVGHLMRWHYDAVRLLIDAAPDVLRRLPTAQFVVVGGGPGLDDLRGQAARAGVAERFQLTGPVPYDAVAREVARIDIGVIPEIFDYAFPVKLVELGASGAAVIAPSSASLDRQLRPGVEYLPIPPGDRPALVDAIVSLAGDADRTAALGAALQRAVRDRFTWSATGRQLAQTIDRVLAARR